MLDVFQLTEVYQIGWGSWTLAFLSAMTLGFAKSGIKGLGALVVTLMALAFDVKASTGIVLALLIFGDVLAVMYYNKSAEWKYIFKLMPWMIIGVLLGVWVGKDLPAEFFKKGMAAIILGTVVMMFWWENKKEMKIPEGNWLAGIMGLSAGFTTMVGNLAGAFSNIFFLAMKVPKYVFIGTAAWLFFIINVFKMPFHIWVWETVSVETLGVFVRLIPGVLFGFFIGVLVVKRIPEKFFRKMILILTAIGAIVIFLK